MVSTSRILVAVVQMCYGAKDWDALNENIMLLTKRRSQLKQVGRTHALVLLLEKVKLLMCDLHFLKKILMPSVLIRLLLRWYRNVTSMWILSPI